VKPLPASHDPDVSIVVPVFNSEKTIEGLVSSRVVQAERAQRRP